MTLRPDPAPAEEFRRRGWWRDSTIVDDFLATRDRDPTRLAIKGYRLDSEPEVLDYASLGTRVDALAASLLDLGVGQQDVVSFQLPNWWEFAAVMLACSRIGAVSNPILPILRRREVAFILERVGSRVLFTPHQYRGFDHAAMVDELRPHLPDLEHVIVVERDPLRSSHTLRFSDLVERSVSDPDRVQLDALRPNPDDPTEIIFTSGTTGEPKGVVHTHNTLYAGIRCVPEMLRLDASDVAMMFSPLSHQTGYAYGVCMPFMYGIPIVYLDGWEPRRMLQIVSEDRVSWTMGASTFVLDACAAAQDAPSDTSSLRYFTCGGAPIPPHAIALARDVLGTQLVAVWGMTELGIATSTAPEDSSERVASSDGRPLPWVDLRIADDQGRTVPNGTVGRVLVRSASQHVSYFGRQDLYDLQFDNDGWFDTGDLARQDDHGHIRISGRVKDLVIRGGENIPVVEVESELLAHPAVRAAAIVGYPDERLGERACAFVVLEPACEFTLDDLRAHLNERGMAKQFWPERLEVRDELPVTSTGKVRKFALKEQLASSQG